jgi:hypothetical protein|mmetsp:Transcript_40498/g.63335  ORF Transcript_40498/g.63335 Transcript_40498/m.63335 type:complete len:135 (-) Transcript_40498:647-1051(-)
MASGFSKPLHSGQVGAPGGAGGAFEPRGRLSSLEEEEETDSDLRVFLVGRDADRGLGLPGETETTCVRFGGGEGVDDEDEDEAESLLFFDLRFAWFGLRSFRRIADISGSAFSTIVFSLLSHPTLLKASFEGQR